MEYELEIGVFLTFVILASLLTIVHNPDFSDLSHIAGRVAQSAQSSEAHVYVNTYINTLINRTPVNFTNGTGSLPGYEYNATVDEGWPLELIILKETNVNSETSYRSDYNNTALGGKICTNNICGGNVYENWFNASNLTYNTSGLLNYTDYGTQQYWPHHVYGFANVSYSGDQDLTDFNQTTPAFTVVYNATCPCGDPVNYSQYIWNQLNLPSGIRAGDWNTTVFLQVDEI